MNCIIVGTGWLGFPLANNLVKAGHQVWGANRSEKSSDNRLFWPFVYPGNNEPLKNAEVVVLAFPPNRNSPDAYANDCLNVVSHCSDSCRIILISSTGAYTKTGVCTENDVIHDPDSENTLVRAESRLRDKLQERLTIIRMAGLIGPDRYPIRPMAASGKTYPGNDPVNVIHQDDAVGLIKHVLENRISGETINGCSVEHPSRKVFYSYMAEKTGLPAPLFDDSMSDSKIIDPAKSLELGYRYIFPNPMDFPF